MGVLNFCDATFTLEYSSIRFANYQRSFETPDLHTQAVMYECYWLLWSDLLLLLGIPLGICNFTLLRFFMTGCKLKVRLEPLLRRLSTIRRDSDTHTHTRHR
jgi:hypothetical protein